MAKPKFRLWFFGWFFGSFLSNEKFENSWKDEAKKFYKNDFFDSQNSIETPLSWTKDIIFEGYKITMDTYKQLAVALITALFSATLWSGLMVRKEGDILFDHYFKYFLGLLVFAYIIIYLRMKFAVATKDMMLTVVLEHNCMAINRTCSYKHFPPTATGSIVNTKVTTKEITSGQTKNTESETDSITKPI